MNCFLENERGGKYVMLTFKREQLLYDIKNCSFIEGSVMATENGHNRHMVQDVGEEGNVDRVTRILDLAVDKCKELLYPYTKHNVHRDVLDDKFKETETYGIVMKLPPSFSQTSLNYLEKLIHEYLVYKAVVDWMGFTNPPKLELWKTKVSEIESEIKRILLSRTKRIRIRLHPF